MTASYISLSFKTFKICFHSVKCINSLANGSSTIILSRSSSFTSVVSKHPSKFSLISCFSLLEKVSGIMPRKTLGRSVSSFIFRPFAIKLNTCFVPITDWREVEVTQYFFTRGSSNNGAEYSLIPARRSTRTAVAPKLLANFESTSAKIYSLFRLAVIVCGLAYRSNNCSS